jgi:hypothetical protein
MYSDDEQDAGDQQQDRTGVLRSLRGTTFPVRRKTALFAERFRSFLAESGILTARVYA